MTAQPAQRTQTEISYDEVIYESFSYPQTHPQHLYTVAKLFGLNPIDFRKAKVLELGCAGGGNILPLAMEFPKSHFTGIDLSREQIDIAVRHAQALTLDNIAFRQEDLMAFDLDGNQEAFDYIICHGVYSWVPEAARARILELCARCLTPDGLAIISYNTLPGWNAVRSLREMMLYHVRRFSRPEEKIMQARALLDFLLENVPVTRAGYRATIQEELNLLKKTNNSYLFHEHLEPDNRQFYFNEFMAAANTHGLGYVGDSSLSGMFVGNFSLGAVEKLQGMNDVIAQEQYMDFIANRRFRSSILSKRAKNATRNLRNEQVLDFYVTASLKPERLLPDPKNPVTFIVAGGQKFTTHTEAASTLYLEHAANGGKPVKSTELIKRTQKRLKQKSSAEAEKGFVDTALQLVLRGLLKLDSYSPDFTQIVTEKPVSHPFARYQAGLKGCTVVTNALMNTVTIDLLTAACLRLADGTRTVGDMVDALTEDASNGVITVNKEGQRLTNVPLIRVELTAQVTITLSYCAEQALFIA